MDISTVRRAIQTAEPFTAPGISGWTVDHYKSIVRANRITPLLNIITIIERAMGRGLLPPGHCAIWLLKSAIGVPIPKAGKNIEVSERRKETDDGPIRPLAIGDAIRRIAIRARIIKVGNSALRKATGHNQTGVAVTSGAEIASCRLKLRMRMLLEEERATGTPESEKLSRKVGIVSCDVSNAFQNMSRDHLIDATNTRCPAFNGLARFLYSEPGEIVLDTPDAEEGQEKEGDEQFWSVDSTKGVHQGCPLGPILFAIGL